MHAGDFIIMKVIKSLLAIMVVAVMVIAPLAVANADAADTKVPAADAEKGYYIENAQNITDPGKFVKVADYSDVMSALFAANNYVNTDILERYNPSKTSVTGLDISSYKDSKYSSLSGLTDEYLGLILYEGYVQLEVTITKDGKLFMESKDAADGDLLKEANKYFGEIEEDSKITMKINGKIEASGKTVSKYAEAKDRFVLLSTEEEDFRLISATTEYTYGSKTVKIENNYKLESYKEYNYTYTNEISVDENAPAFAKKTVLPSYELSDCSLKGKVDDKDYSSDYVEKMMKDECDEYVKAYEQKEPKDCEAPLSYDISPANATLEYTLDVPTEEAAKAKLTENGFTGADDASKAKSITSDAYKELGGKIGTGSSSSSSGIPVWVWIIIVVAVIIVAVVVIVLLKKNGKI